jgi:NAD-reducing hydrogenase large subunit
MRRLMHYGQTLQSHALHFFHLASPDLLFGFGSDPRSATSRRGGEAPGPRQAGRPAAQVRPGDHPRHGRQEDPRHGRDPRRHQQEPLDRGARRAAGRVRSDPRVVARRGSRGTTRSRTSRRSRTSARSRANHLCLVRDDGAMDLYHGGLRALDATARRSSTTWRRRTTSSIVEEVRDWSYMKFPYIRSLGRETAGTGSGRSRASTPATSSTRRWPRRRGRSSWR